MAILQAKEYETAGGKIQLQFVELLGTGLNDSAFAYVMGMEQKEFNEFIEKQYGAEVIDYGSFFGFNWKASELKQARLFKNALNAKARKIKFKVEFE